MSQIHLDTKGILRRAMVSSIAVVVVVVCPVQVGHHGEVIRCRKSDCVQQVTQIGGLMHLVAVYQARDEHVQAATRKNGSGGLSLEDWRPCRGENVGRIKRRMLLDLPRHAFVHPAIVQSRAWGSGKYEEMH
jgi:hypothetical protein